MSVFTNSANRAAEDASAYVRAVLDLLGDREPMKVLRDTLAKLPDAISGLSTTELRRPEREGRDRLDVDVAHVAADLDLQLFGELGHGARA